MESSSGRLAVVTGAAGGIGAALARRLAGLGCPVALCDVDGAGVERVRASCNGSGVAASGAVVDVADAAAVDAWAGEVLARHGTPFFVFNNAGTTVVGDLHEISLEEMRWLVDVNFWGVVHGTRAYLPAMEKAGGGHLVNVSSLFGLVGFPGQATYCATKFAVRGFSESLAMELALRKSPVRVHVVHPGGVATGIVRNARVAGDRASQASHEESVAAFDRVARTAADEAARQILDGVRRGRRRILVGRDARGISLLQRLMPERYAGWFERGVRKRGLG